MKTIHTPTFTEADIYVMENIDQDTLDAVIDFLRDYKEVMWLDNDSGDIASYSELMKRRPRRQPQPQYPQEMNQMARMFSVLRRGDMDFRINLGEVGFFMSGSLAAHHLGTMYSPSLIASFVIDAYSRDRFCDGLFGFGVEGGLYLKMLLHLKDQIAYYEFTKNVQRQP